MSKLKTKELIICMITLALLVLSVTGTFASSPDIANVFGNNTTNNTTNTTPNNVTNIPNAISNNTANNSVANSNTPNGLAKTGIEFNYSTILIISICIISAIYAYKKIRDYNV